MKKTVSVVICTNLLRKKKLKRCLLSVLNQELRPDEVLVISHGRPDEALTKFVENFNDWKQIHTTATNLADLRNIALKSSASSVIAFIDDDAFAPKDWVKNITAVFKEYSPAMSTGPILTSEPLNYWSKFSELFSSPGLRIESETYFVVGANFAVNKHFFLKKKLHFSDIFKYGEDNQISILVKQAKGLVRYAPNCFIFHDYRYAFKEFFVQQKNFKKYEYLLMRVYQYNYFGFMAYKRFPYLFPIIFLLRCRHTLSKVGSSWIFGVLVQECSTVSGLVEGMFTWRKFYKTNSDKVKSLRVDARNQVSSHSAL